MLPEPIITVDRKWRREFDSAYGSEGWVPDDLYTITNPDGSVDTCWWLDPESRKIFERQQRSAA